MPAPRTSRTVAERLDLGAYRDSSPLRRLRWKLGWAAVALVLAIPLAGLIRSDKTIYQSGSLSLAHQFIANDCSRCHDRPGQTAWRALSLSGSVHSVSEQACLSCHAAPAHHTAKLSTRTCGECHREHEGPGRLSRVASGFCTECHADLPESASFARSINSLQQHPEFAVLRKADDASVGEKHELLKLAKQDSQTGRWKDKSAIALNHKVHLNPNGIPTQTSARSESVRLEHLDCQSCHQPEAETGNFAPISFEQHCARCHEDQLSFLGSEAGELKGVQPLPHREPETLLGMLRERLSKALQARGAAKPQADSPPLRRFFPGVPETKPLNESEAEELARLMHQAEGLLFSPKGDGAKAGAGCAYCHVVSRDGDDVKITPPAIPNRWLPHSRFRHEAHRQLGCTGCHDQTPNSTATSDVLLPSIDVCRKCHQDGRAGTARGDCVQCHSYHLHSTLSWDGKHALP